MLPLSLATKETVVVAEPLEQEPNEVDTVIIRSQSIVLFVTFVVNQDPEDGLESPYL